VNTFRKKMMSMFLVHVMITKATISTQQATNLSLILQSLLRIGLNLYLKLLQLQRISLSLKNNGEHFMGPISNSNYGGVELIRSCFVEFQPILALRAQQDLLMSMDFSKFLQRMRWLPGLRNSITQR
jgi:hypothetical protein